MEFCFLNQNQKKAPKTFYKENPLGRVKNGTEKFISEKNQIEVRAASALDEKMHQALTK